MSDPELATAYDVARCLALHAVECERERVRQSREDARVLPMPDAASAFLTARERQVIGLADGMSRKRVASILGITVGTVASHLRAARGKT